MEEQQIEEVSSPLTFKQKTTLFVPSALAAGGIPALLHAPLPLAAAGVIGAFCLAYKSPGIHEELVKHVPQLAHVSRPQVKDTSPGEWTLRDRMMGRHLQQRQSPDAVQESLDRRAEHEHEEDCYALGTEQGIPSFALDSGVFTFSQLLASGFRPTMEKIFLGRLPDGTDITVAVRDLCHVALAGNTGGGKSSLMRLIVAQLCYLKVPTVLLNPHYMPYDHDAGEDWTPFDHALSAPAAGCAEYDMIAKYLRWAAEVELPERIALARNGGKPRRACFFVLDELPAIVKHIKQAPEWIAAILREGRKYGLFLIVASQDFLAKTVSNKDGEGEIRKQYRTALYVGGGVTTAKVLLDVQDASDIPETQLGMGTIMLRCKATKSAVLANVCYVDNESLYALLGPSTFNSDAADDGNNNLVVSVPGNGGNTPGNAAETPSEADLLPSNVRPFPVSAPNVSGASASVQEVPGVGNEIRETIKRMRRKGMAHREIAQLVGMAGRRYGQYKQVCREEGIDIERVEGEA